MFLRLCPYSIPVAFPYSFSCYQSIRHRQKRRHWSSPSVPLATKSSDFSTEFDESSTQIATPQQWSAALDLARIHNVIPSMLLVFFGAWKSTHRSWMVFADIRVWVMSLVAAGIAVGSVIANDYFDYLTGVDTINSPDKPIPSGLIRPDIALLMSHFIYVFALVAGCVLEPQMLRWIIAFSASSTLLYTSVLKPVTLVKNFLVATVIGLSPISGALAVGTGEIGIWEMRFITAFVVGSIVFREVLMDISDVEGDRETKIFTLPVVIGRVAALGIAVGALSLGCAAGLWSLANGEAVQFLARYMSDSIARGIVLALFCFNALPLFVSAVKTARNNFDKDALQQTIGQILIPIAVNFLMLAAIG